MILLKAKLTEKRPIDVVRDAWREITRGAYRAVGLHWVKTYLKGHFDVGAGQKYNYQFRGKQYRQRKDRAFAAGRPIQKGGAPVIAGSDRPNVLTGYMMREMMRNVIVRGFPSRATVIMLGPKYLSTRFHKKRQPDKPAEITKVREDERRDCGRVLERELKERIESYRGTKVTE